MYCRCDYPFGSDKHLSADESNSLTVKSVLITCLAAGLPLKKKKRGTDENHSVGR
jgi:hypothetical protein